MDISFEGIGQTIATFYCSDEIEYGTPVKLSGNAAVAACTEGDAFNGVAAAAADGGIVPVIMRGFIKLPYTGTAPTAGTGVIAADGKGGVKTASAGRSLTIIDVDKTNSTVVLYI